MNILDKAYDMLRLYGAVNGLTPIVYRMGGDLDGSPKGLDCSAFAARCCGHRKYDPISKLWFGTDRIYADALSTTGHRRWVQIDQPEPGCIGVYPGRRILGIGLRAGHVWIVESVARQTVIDCSSSGKGIRLRHKPEWFAKDAKGNGKPIIFARYVGP